MPVKIRILGEVARLAGSEPMDVDQAGCTLAVALQELAARYPRLGAEMFDDEGRMRRTWVLALDGARAQWPRDKERLIPDGGELLVTRFYGGG